MNVKGIEKILEEYKYGRYNFLDEEFRITETNSGFEMKNFFKEKEKTGDCIELAEHLFENPELYEHVDKVYKVEGNTGPNSVFSDYNSHTFLITPPKKLIAKLENMDDYHKVKTLSRTNYGVIDPSYGLVSNRNDSKYKINRISNDKKTKPLDMTFFKPYTDTSVSIASENNTRFELTEDDSQLFLTIKTPDMTEMEKLESLNLDKFQNYSVSLPVLEALQKKYETRTIK